MPALPYCEVSAAIAAVHALAGDSPPFVKQVVVFFRSRMSMGGATPRCDSRFAGWPPPSSVRDAGSSEVVRGDCPLAVSGTEPVLGPRTASVRRGCPRRWLGLRRLLPAQAGIREWGQVVEQRRALASVLGRGGLRPACAGPMRGGRPDGKRQGLEQQVERATGARLASGDASQRPKPPLTTSTWPQAASSLLTPSVSTRWRPRTGPTRRRRSPARARTFVFVAQDPEPV